MVSVLTHMVLIFSDGSLVFSNYRLLTQGQQKPPNIFFQNDLTSLTKRSSNNFWYKSSPSVYKIQYIQKR